MTKQLNNFEKKILSSINDSSVEWLKAIEIVEIIGRGKKKEWLLYQVQDALKILFENNYLEERMGETSLGHGTGIKEYTLSNDAFYELNFE